jgi:TPR repeat protein
MSLALSARTLGALLLLPALSFSQQSISQQSVLDQPSDIAGLRSSAAKVDAVAERKLAEAYERGNGVNQSDQLAANWYRKAADLGDAEAQNRLGVMYSLGRGVEKSQEDALRWYHSSAKQGYAQAMFNLGASYYNGDGVQSDATESCPWFLLAAEAGNSAAEDAVRRATTEDRSEPRFAFTKIAEMYTKGDELPKDPLEALKWYRKAADAGDAKASVAVARLLLSGTRPTQEEGAEARHRCEDAAKLNFSPGAYCVVLIYERGLGTSKDPVEAKKWLARAADLGHSQAALELGEAYWKGDGVQKDLVAAYTWIWVALNAKVPGAQQDEQVLKKEMTTKQVEQAKRKASEWAIKHRLPTIYERQAGSSRPQQ